jgi:GntR family transcriptional regulator
MSGSGGRVSVESTPRGKRQSAAYRAYMLLRFAIKAGGLPTGMLVEERPIMEGFGFSRAAVREALATLSADGLIDRKTGTGTTIRVRPVPIALLDVVPLATDQRISVRLTETYRLGESRYLDMRLGTHAAEDLVMSEFYLSVGGEAIGVLSVFSPGGVPGTSMLRPAWEMPSLRDAFPRQYGVEFGGMELSIDARLADDSLAAVLGVQPGAPILAREQVLRDADGLAWEYGFAQYRADKVLFRSTGTPGGDLHSEVEMNWAGDFTNNRY